MAASLFITKPANRLIYINGNYKKAAGNSSSGSITVSTGGNIAETLNGEDKIDYRKEFTVRPRDKKVTIELDPVDPPENQ